MAEQDSWISLRTELAHLRTDQQYKIFRPLIDHLESLVKQRADERDRAFSKVMLEIIKKLQLERKRGGRYSDSHR